MNDRKIRKCIKDLESLIILEGHSLEQAYQSRRSEYEEFDFDSSWFEALDLARNQLKEERHGIERLGAGRRLRGQRYEPWYSGPPVNSRFWPAYVSHLKSKGKDWEGAIPSIDETSSAVVSMLPNPGHTNFSGRGLVLGYVQSGKTANMTGVMAKAADANYRFIIVLAGMTDKLRNQTQKRFVSDLISHDTDQIWHEHTTVDSDFCAPEQPGFVFGSQYRHIMVVKKNTHVLNRLYNKLQNTNISELRGCPVLIIDDECDQASVNASGYIEKMTAINAHIRNIINMLPRVAYLGYTATPFANLLIDPSIDPDNPEDLYPRDFIYTLPKPDSYFGAERIFGRDMLDADDEPPTDEDLYILRPIPEEEWDSLRPRNAKERDSFVFDVTESLEKAINYYLMATCARNTRGDRCEHSSMLIHTTMLITPQSQIAQGIEQYLKTLRARFTSDNRRLHDEMQALWESEHAKVSSEAFQLVPVLFEAVWSEMKETLDSTEVAVENGESDSRVHYDDNGELGKRYIVVGGNVLARGLTIEGLVVSYFLRTSAQYCTLMQMGRWFGYRGNYEDLPRIWMTTEMQNNFLDLATVEAEIRYEIEVYERGEVTPLDCAVKIRKLPGLAITAKNKMMAAQRCRLSFNGTHRQTRRFYHRSREILQFNWDAGARLIDSAIADGASIDEQRKGGRLLSGVTVNHVERFLDEYRIHEKHPDLVETKAGRVTNNHLIEHIKRQNEINSMSHGIWNIVMVEPENRQLSELELGGLGYVNTVNRSVFQFLDNGDADIKALMSKSDIRIDLPPDIKIPLDWSLIKNERMKHDKSSRPMLLLYAIDRNSAPKSDKTERKPLDAVMDILGVGFVFPGVDDKNDTVYYVQVDVEEDTEQDEGFEAVANE